MTLQIKFEKLLNLHPGNSVNYRLENFLMIRNSRPLLSKIARREFLRHIQDNCVVFITEIDE